MSAWWESLSIRERIIVTVGGLLLVLFLLWLSAWRPLSQSRQLLAVQLEAQSAELEWMRAAAAEVNRLKGQTQRPRPDRGNQSLLALSEQTAREAGLAGAFRRGEPAGAGQVRIWVEGAAFTTLMTWLEQLESDFGILVEDGSLERSGIAGQVDARLLLAEP